LTTYGIWRPYGGVDALALALALLLVGAAFAFLGIRLRRPVGPARPGKALGFLLVLTWLLSLATFAVALGTYRQALFQQAGPVSTPASPIAPVTALSAVVALVAIAFLSRHHDLWTALSSAVVGAIAAPMMFELPFDLIVMWRTPHPEPETLFALLYFLPLFMLEISSFSLLTLSPLARVSKYTLFALATVFFVFAVWALTGFSYPSSPMPFALNATSKVMCFVAAVTLFLPRREST
jgi:hypothetical protein